MDELEGPARPVPIRGRDWTQGNILRNFLLLSWPMAVTNGLTMMGAVMDMVWVGRLGPTSVAAVASGGIIIGLAIVTGMGLTMGTRAIIARFIGAGDVPGANHVAQQSLAISLMLSTVLAMMGFSQAESILRLLGLEADVIAAGLTFMRIMFLGSIAIAFRMMCEGIIQASGDTLTPLWVSVIYGVIRMALAPILVFGNETFSWWPLSGLGISGTAVSSTFAQTMAAVILIWLLFTGRSRLHLTLKGFHLDFHIMWRIIRIGLPSLVGMMQGNLSQFILVRLMAPFGTVAIAAHGIVQRVEGLVMMPTMALGMGAGVLVGQNLGAKQPGRAEKSAWTAVGVVEAITAAFSVVILLWSEGIAGIFSSDPAMVATSSTFLRIAVVGYLLMGFMAALGQSLNGAGDTLPPMLLGVAMIWLVTLPLAYFLPQITDLGVNGVRWAMVIGMIFAGITTTAYFMTGRWKRKVV